MGSAVVWRLLAGAVALLGGCGAVLTLAGLRSPVNGSLTLLFLLAGPALGVAMLLPDRPPFVRAVVAGTTSIALCGLVAEVMLAAGAWSPRGGVAVVGGCCLVLAAVAVGRHARIGRSAPGRHVASPRHRGQHTRDGNGRASD